MARTNGLYRRTPLQAPHRTPPAYSRRQLGIAVIVGSAIGSGILRTPGLVAAQLRNPSLIIAAWLAGGLYAFCCTVSVIELGTMLTRAGGWYVYSRRARSAITPDS